MDSNRSTLTVFGALVGLIILVLVVFAAVGTFRDGATKLDEQSRAAGRPITLAETVAMTDTAAMTETATVTEATAVTETAALTETAPATTTTAVTATAATTETAPATTAVTTTAEVTATAPATTTAEVTATETTTTAEVTATTPVTESVATTTTTEVTATTPVTTEAAPAAATDGAPADVVAIITKATCFACHMIPGVPGAAGMVGPDLTGIGTAAATRVPGQTAEQYIHESIVNPNAVIAPKCPTGPCLPNVMLPNLAQTLTAEEIDKVVAYLVTLK